MNKAFRRVRKFFGWLAELDRDPDFLDMMARNNLKAIIATASVSNIIGVAGILGNTTARATTPVISAVPPYLIYVLLLCCNVPVLILAAAVLTGKLKYDRSRSMNLIACHVILNMVLAALTIYSTQTGSSFYFEVVLIVSPLAMLPVYRFKRLLLVFTGSFVLLMILIRFSGVYLGWQDQYDIFIFYFFCIVISCFRHRWFVSQFRTDKQLKEINTQLHEKSRTDGLTGLRNRTALEEDIRIFTDSRICIAMLDVDFFKEMNDRLGHLEGDRVLRNLAGNIREVFQDSAFCYRYGGDEFMVLDEKDTPDVFSEKLDTLQGKLRDESQSVTIGYSYGRVRGEREIRTMLADADNNLYIQKGSRKGGILGKAYEGGGVHSGARDRRKLDTMTGLLTFNAFIRQLEKEYDPDWTLICLDVDRFEQFNREFGYKEGDSLLTATARMIQQEFPGCPAARWDDQFAIYTTIPDYEKKISAIQGSVDLQNKNRYLILRAGILRSSDGFADADARTMIDMAKYACDSLRGQSSVQICYYDSKLNIKRENKSFVQNHFKEALEKGCIVPYFQPIMSTPNEKCEGYEALARWFDKEKGMISPGDFIPVLEESMESYLLDFYMLRSVCQVIKANRLGTDKFFVSVNFSRTDFYVCDVPERIEAIVSSSGIDRQRLRVEVTESAFTEDPRIRQAITDLREKGYLVWIDDFGSGMSSLNALQNYSVDTVKIDLAFLKNSETNPRSLTIVSEIIHLCHAIGLRALIEGVETKKQEEFVTQNGIDLIQGYYYGKPMPLEEIHQPK